MIPQERIEAEAEKSLSRYNHKDGMILYEMRKCGKLSFIQGMLRALEIVKEDNSLIEKAPVMEDLRMLVKTLTKIKNIMSVAPTKAPLADSIIIEKAQEALTAIKEKYGELK